MTASVIQPEGGSSQLNPEGGARRGKERKVDIRFEAQRGGCARDGSWEEWIGMELSKAH